MSTRLNNISSTLFNQISKTGILVKAAQDAANGILKDLDLSETQKTRYFESSENYCNTRFIY